MVNLVQSTYYNMFTVGSLYVLVYTVHVVRPEYSAESALYHKLHLPVELITIIHLPTNRQDPTDGIDGIDGISIS